MTTISEIIARWDAGDSKPYKGSLINLRAYDADPNNIGCMCAQGQVLHLLAGWNAEQLDSTDQEKADEATAKLLNISTAHAILLRQINDSVDGAPSIVLTDPAKVLGHQADKVLAFWLHLDSLSTQQWDAARDAAWDAAWAAAGAAAGAAAWAAAGASNEIQGAAVMRKRKQAFYFLPLFGFDNSEAIPALPADYGIGGAA